MNIEERVQHYASSYSGILPNVLIESSKEWWRKELEEVAEEAEKRGFARGQLAEIEANAVSDITIAKEKVEQIREEGRREEREKLVEWVEYYFQNDRGIRDEIINHIDCLTK